MKRLLAISAAFAMASAAYGQVNPNAVGMWRSDKLPGTVLFIPSVPAGSTGNHVWCVLPPDVLTYFKPQADGGVRELDFWGFTMVVGLPANPGTTAVTHNGPRIELRRAVQANAPNEGRWVPDVSTPAFVTIPEQINQYTVAAGTTGNGLNYTTKMLTVPVKVPAGSATGDGLCFRWVDYMKQYGSTATAPQSLMIAFTGNNTTAGESGTLAQNLSGQTTPAGGDVWISFGGANGSTEMAVTFYFEQSMITPVKNVKPLAPGSAVPGGVLPASVTAGFTMDDGHGALNPVPGDVISFQVNSNKQAKLGAQAGNVQIVPLVLFSGDVAGGAANPNPEDWVASGGSAQESHIHPMPLQRWLEDIATTFGLFPGLGLGLNPNNSTLGLWLGSDSANGYFNLQVLLNCFALSDLAGGFVGPEIRAYNKTSNPTGSFSRNLVQWNANLIGELRSLSRGQYGYTPIVPVGATGSVGIVEYPQGVPQLQGTSFYITAWIMDISSPTNPPVNILDMTNVVKISL